MLQNKVERTYLVPSSFFCCCLFVNVVIIFHFPSLSADHHNLQSSFRKQFSQTGKQLAFIDQHRISSYLLNTLLHRQATKIKKFIVTWVICTHCRPMMLHVVRYRCDLPANSQNKHLNHCTTISWEN